MTKTKTITLLTAALLSASLLGSTLAQTATATVQSSPARQGPRTLVDFGLPESSVFDTAVSLETTPQGLPFELALRGLVRAIGYTPFTKNLPAIQINTPFKNLPFSQVMPVLLGLYAQNVRLTELPNKILVIEGIPLAPLPGEKVATSEPFTVTVAEGGPDYPVILGALGARVTRSRNLLIVQAPAESRVAVKALIDTLEQGRTEPENRILSLDATQNATTLLPTLRSLYPDTKFEGFGSQIIARGPAAQLGEAALTVAAVRPKPLPNSPLPTPPSLVTHFYTPRGQAVDYAKSLNAFYPNLRLSTVGNQLVVQFDASLEGEINAFIGKLEQGQPTPPPPPAVNVPAEVPKLATYPQGARSAELAVLLPKFFNVKADSGAGLLLVQGSAESLAAVDSFVSALATPTVQAPVTPPEEESRSFDLLGKSDEVLKALEGSFDGKLSVLPSLNLLLATGRPRALDRLERTLTLINKIPPPPPAPEPIPVVAMIPKITQSVLLQGSSPSLEGALGKLLPNLSVVRGNGRMFLSGNPDDLTQAANLIASIDAPDPKIIPPPPAPPAPVRQTQTIKLQGSDPGLEAALAKILPDLIAVRSGGVLILSGFASDLAQAATLLASVDVPDLEVKPPPPAPIAQSRNYPLSYAVADTLVSVIKPNTGALVWSVDTRSNTLIGLGSTAELDAAAKLITSLDTPLRQAALRIKVTQIDLSAAHSLGIDWSGLTQSLSFGTVQALSQGDLTKLNIALNLLESRGATRTLTDTAYLTQSGKTATLISGGAVLLPVSTTSAASGAGAGTTSGYQSYTYGLNIAVTPTVTLDDMLIMNVSTSLGRPPTSGVGGAVQLPTQSYTSTVQFKSGQTVLFGGLVGESTSQTVTGIPVLKDIPLLGGLFSTTVKTRSTQALLITLQGESVLEPEKANKDFGAGVK